MRLHFKAQLGFGGFQICFAANKVCPADDWNLVNNRTCIGFSDKQTNVTESRRLCRAKGGQLFDGGKLNMTELLRSATEFLNSQNRTKQEWFWIDAYYNSTSKKARWTSNAGNIYHPGDHVDAIMLFFPIP